jgi:hypothetical protein
MPETVGAERAGALADGREPPVQGEPAELLGEMVAKTHERAAALYESWIERRGDRSHDDLVDRARAHRERADAARSVERLAERALQWFEARAAAGSAASGKVRSLRMLSALERLRALIDHRIEDRVALSRRDGATWAEIAEALRMRRQSAHQRFR